jgi:hypothetical protein
MASAKGISPLKKAKRPLQDVTNLFDGDGTARMQRPRRKSQKAREMEEQQEDYDHELDLYNDESMGEEEANKGMAEAAEEEGPIEGEEITPDKGLGQAIGEVIAEMCEEGFRVQRREMTKLRREAKQLSSDNKDLKTLVLQLTETVEQLKGQIERGLPAKRTEPLSFAAVAAKSKDAPATGANSVPLKGHSELKGQVVQTSLYCTIESADDEAAKEKLPTEI